MARTSPEAAAAKKPMGAPTLLTEETARKICDLVRGGNYPETAAAAAGVARTTLLGWMKEGAIIRRRLGNGASTARLSKHRRALVDFSTSLERAFAEAEARDVMLISRAASGTDKRPGDWRASAFLLERRNKARWAEKVEQEVGGSLSVDHGDEAATAKQWVLDKIKRLSELQAQQKKEPPGSEP